MITGPLYAFIDCSNSGINHIVPGVSGKRIIALGYVLVVASAVTVKWQDTVPNELSGPMPFAASGGAAAPTCPFFAQSPVGHFQTANGAGLDLNLGSGVQASGHLAYCLSDAP